MLEHITEREQILANLVRALRPGGTVLVEDLDYDESMRPALARYVRPIEHADSALDAWSALVRLVEAHGGDLTWASRMPDAFVAAGLVDVGSSVHIANLPGGVPRHFLGLSVEQVRPKLVDLGLLAPTDIDQVLAFYGKIGTSVPLAPVVSAWGRKRG